MMAIKTLRALFTALLFASSLSFAQSLQPLNHQPPIQPGAAYLLTDGTILVQQYSSNNWEKLTPDQNGSYVNGTWSNVAPLPAGYAPLDYAAAVLADGRLVIIGGEYNFAVSPKMSESTLGAVYDPKSDAWTPIAPPTSWSSVGDAPSAVLPNGQFLLGDILGTDLALLDPATLTWSAAQSDGKITNSLTEEGFTLLPDGTLLDVTVFNDEAQRYLPSTGQWISAGFPPQSLRADNEMGPAVLRPDGTVFAMGASGANAVYTPPNTLTGTGTWAAGPDLVVGDAPACLLPDGNVLVESSAGLYEFDGVNLTPVIASSGIPYAGFLLGLPNGQVLFISEPGAINIYTPSGTPNPAWAPTIASFPAIIGPSATYAISGTQFNGLSQAVAFGDDYQAATNYPLVRITNQSTGHVFYARTHDHSTMAVATGSAIVSTNFDVPANIELGASNLVVVANGIPSAPVSITVQALGSSTTTLSSSLSPSAGSQAVRFTATVTASGSPTGTVTFLDGIVRLGTGTLNGSGVATFTTSSLIVGSHAITAEYGGDAKFSSSPSTITQIVTGTTSTALLTSSRNPSFYPTFTATVTGSGGTPTGTVTFFDGTVWMWSATLTGGTATLDVAAVFGSVNGLSDGSHSITFQYSGDPQFAPSTSNTVIQMAGTQSGGDFALPTVQPTITVTAPGQTGTASVLVTPTGGFTGTVSLSCTVPANMNEASCSATPAQITGAIGIGSTLTVTTTAPHQLASSTNRNRRSSATGAMLLAGCIWFGVATLRRRRLGATLFLVLLLGYLGTIGCGGGGGGTQTDPGTPAGNYTLVVTGTSGSLSHSIDISVNVQ